MREPYKLSPELASAGAQPGEPYKRGAAAQTARALKAWGEKNPNPFTPRSRAASQQFHTNNTTSK